MDIKRLKEIKNGNGKLYCIVNRRFSRRALPEIAEYEITKVGRKYVSLGDWRETADMCHCGNGTWGNGFLTVEMFETWEELDAYTRRRVLREGVAGRIRSMVTAGGSIPEELIEPLAELLGVSKNEDE